MSAQNFLFCVSKRWCPIRLHSSQMGENRLANQQTKTGTDLGKILTDFLDKGRRRKLLGGPVEHAPPRNILDF